MKDIGDRGNRQGNFLPAQKRQLDFFALKDNGLASKLAAVIEFDFTELGIRLGSRGLKAEVQDLGNRSDDFLLLDLEDDFLVGEADEVAGIRFAGKRAEFGCMTKGASHNESHQS